MECLVSGECAKWIGHHSRRLAPCPWQCFCFVITCFVHHQFMFSSSCHLISRHLINPVEHNNNTNNSNHNNNKNNSWHPEIYFHWNILSKAHLPGYQAGPYGSRCGLNRNMGWAHHKVHHKPHSYDTIIIKKNDPLILTGVF